MQNFPLLVKSGICLEKKTTWITNTLFSSTQKRKKLNITRSNCELDRRAILCLYVPGFQRQIFKQVPKCNWIPLTKFLWNPRTNIFNVNFVGTLVVSRIPRQAHLASCSDVRNCMLIPRFCILLILHMNN